MVKINLMRLAAFVVICLFVAGTTNAQTKVWGVGSATGVADAEFSSAFTQTGTAASYGATVWTALSVSQDDGTGTGNTITPGNAYWTRSLTGLSQGAYAGSTPASSASMSNGIAIFDSDFMDNGGVQGAFGTGTSPSDHIGELISPRIDLTGYTDSALVVQFYLFWRNFYSDLTLSVSTDDGLTWPHTVDLDVLLPCNTNDPPSEGMVRALFTNATAGVTNLTQCRIKFGFDGGYYYAMLDDITIEVAPLYDIAMGNPDNASNNLVDNGNFVKIGSNAYIPSINVDPTDLREWFWGGKVANYGAVTLYPQDSVAMYCSIDFVDAITGLTTSGVYTDTMWFDTVYAGDASGRSNIEYLRDLSFLSTYGEGRYNVKYWAAHKNSDGTASNDTVTHNFTITGSSPLTNYLSKARIASSDSKVFAATGVFPGGGPYAEYEYGSVYYFPKGASDSISIDSIDFRYRLAGSFTGAATQTLFLNVYELDPSAGVLNDGNLLTQIGVGVVSLSGLGTTVTPNSYGLTTVTSLQDASAGGPMPALNDNGFYYISVKIAPGALGGSPTFDVEDVPFHGADNQNWYMNTAMTTTDSVINPSPLQITDPAGTTTWYWTGFGSDLVPSIGIYLGKQSTITSTTVWETEGAELNVFPNPTSDLLNVSVKFDEATDVTYILTDVSGRVVMFINSNNVSQEVKTIDVSTLTSGVYMLTAKTANGTSTERFIKK
ncbi:MAG: T9SS type A sorting domain-containing protein [Saprospiraceae bacterium]|nr:T9SS type A sorting domain-containing protein [Saprospiraceae bacterium]